MFLKTGVICAPVLFGALYVGGAFGSDWSRKVERPESGVMAALEGLDIGAQPGAPGSDPARAGGVTPMFRLERGAHSMTWRVMSGEKTAVTMTAELQPIDGGKDTKVIAHVARGDAPDDFVSPAFRSTRTTMALFAMALDGQLNKLTAGPGDPAACAELMRQFQEGSEAAGLDRRTHGFSEGMAQGAKAIMRVNEMAGERQRLGCDKLQSGGDFTPVRSEMAPADDRPAGGVNFTPGQPMINPNPPGQRH